MKWPKRTDSRFRNAGIGVALLIQCAAPFAISAVVFRGLQDVPVPTDFTGVYLNVDAGTTGFDEFVGWDINPFFGGVGIATSAAFQPARTGVANEDPIRALAFGTMIDGNLAFSTGGGGSSAHLGMDVSQFGIGQEAYLGFRFIDDANAGPFLGWMRVIFTANTPGGLIKDWGYETTGSPTQAGIVRQDPPIAGVSVVNLSGGFGQDSILGSLIDNLGSGIAIAISKTGAGTWTLAATENYSSITADGGITKVAVPVTGATINANAFSTIEFQVDQTLAALNISDGGVVALSNSPLNFAQGSPSTGSAPSSVTTVPEPGSAALVAGAFVMLLARTPLRGLRSAKRRCE